jgi:predicted phosphodiesterase
MSGTVNEYSHEMESRDNAYAIIMHLSDLHMGPCIGSCHNDGELCHLGAKTHHFNLLQGIEEVYKNLVNEWGQEKVLVAITGDITAAAEPPAYESAAIWIRNQPFVLNSVRSGLGLQNRKFFIVPGNHDIWLRGSHPLTKWKNYALRRELFHRHFDSETPGCHPIKIGEMDLTFFTLDSNKLFPKDKTNVFNWRNMLGKGEVGVEQLKDLRALNNECMKGTYKYLPNNFDYGNSLKIVLMHHHLALPSSSDESGNSSLGILNGVRKLLGIDESRLLRLNDAEDVIGSLREIGAHLILCGHQHHAYDRELGPEGRMYLSCSGSASQLELVRNTFCVYHIKHHANKGYQIQRHIYEAFQKECRFRFNISKVSQESDPIHLY